MPDYGRRRLLEGGGKCLKYLKKGGWNRKEKRGKEDITLTNFVNINIALNFILIKKNLKFYTRVHK